MPQRQNPREPPQEIANKFASLTHNDIPKIIQGFVQSLSNVSPQGESVPRDHTAMSTHSTGTPTQNSKGTTTRLWEAKKGPQREDGIQGSSSSVGQVTEENIQRITQGVIQYLADANAAHGSAKQKPRGRRNLHHTSNVDYAGRRKFFPCHIVGNYIYYI